MSARTDAPTGTPSGTPFVTPAVTGHEPPSDDPDGPTVSLTEIFVFAAVSGAVIGISRQLAQAGAAKWYGGPVRDVSPSA